MKILFIGAAVSNHTLRWVNALSEKGHEVLLVCRGDQKAKPENIAIKPSVKVHYLKFNGGLGYYLNSFELRNIWKEFNPDVTNVHYATGYGTLARHAGIKPVVLSFWGSDIFDYPFHNAFNKMLLHKNIVYSDAIAATSHAMANKIMEVYPDTKSVHVTPFGVDTDLFTPAKRKANKRPIIGIVKYLKPIYDIPLLIKAFAIVKHETDIDPLLHIYGGGPMLEELKELTVKLDIKDDVVFFGTIPNNEIAKAINTMDVFVNCSLTESFGVALLEAMACEVPVIATDTVGFREVVENNVTGIILPDREPETMANEIIRLLKDPALAKRYGTNGRERVKTLYSWDCSIDIMEEVYNGVIKK